jgi:hypothetical protein
MALSLSGIIDILPQALSLAQTLMYLVLSWVLGSFAFHGMKKRIPFALKTVAKFGVGFLCVLAGASLSKYMFFFNGSIFKMLQIDLFVGGLIGAALLGGALYLITRGEVESESKSAKKLAERVKLLEGVLIKQKTPTLKEEEVKKIAESLLPGFAAKQANLKSADWEILLEKGKRKATVVLGAYTGEVRHVERGFDRILDPHILAGIALIIAFMVFSLLNFTGLPSVTEGVASMLGMSDAQFKSLTGSNSLPQGCVATVRILMNQGVSVIGGENTYTDETLKRAIEAATGRDVMLMYKTSYQNAEYIVSITLPQGMDTSKITNNEIMQSAEICTSTRSVFCDCVKIPEVSNMPTGFIVATGSGKH